MLDRYLVDELLPSLTEGGYEVLQSKVDDDTTLAGMPAYQLVSTYTYNGIDYKTLETGIILGDKVYV
ncbi:MAG: hypothetical protein ACM3X1_03460, partial [Ignavibacteriales bacterium]